jgi:hypothetical protein
MFKLQSAVEFIPLHITSLCIQSPLKSVVFLMTLASKHLNWKTEESIWKLAILFWCHQKLWWMVTMGLNSVSHMPRWAFSWQIPSYIFFYCCTMHVFTIISLIPNHQFTLIFKTLKKPSMARFHQDRNSRHTHTTDDNDIWLHTIQEHNERTSTEINLATAQSTAHEPPEDGRIYGLKHVGASFLKCFIVF